MWATLALAVALAMDATAVAAARGLARHRSDVTALPVLFGLFQSGMAAVGWLAGEWGSGYVVAWDHWIAFGLLVAIGGKMMIEAWRSTPGKRTRTGPLEYLGLAVATSIDAAAAGLMLPVLGVEPWFAIATIGGVTAVCTAAGYFAGRAARGLGKQLEFAGGLVLVGLAIRLLVEHL